MPSKKTPFILWAIKLIAAGIMLQTLYFKFSASEESVFIFSTLGIEPRGRILTGILELIASVLILMPRYTFWGSSLGTGLMAGAIFSHLTKLGITIKNDNGLLFMYACAVFISCLILSYRYKNQALKIFQSKSNKSTL